MTKKLYRVDVPVWSTAYILADSKEEALETLRTTDGDDLFEWADPANPTDRNPVVYANAATINLGKSGEMPTIGLDDIEEWED